MFYYGWHGVPFLHRRYACSSAVDITGEPTTRVLPSQCLHSCLATPVSTSSANFVVGGGCEGSGLPPTSVGKGRSLGVRGSTKVPPSFAPSPEVRNDAGYGAMRPPAVSSLSTARTDSTTFLPLLTPAPVNRMVTLPARRSSMQGAVILTMPAPDHRIPNGPGPIRSPRFSCISRHGLAAK